MIREKLITPIWIPVYHRYQMFYNSLIKCGLFALIPILVGVPAFAQWEPDRRLTFNDNISQTSANNARCVAASGDTVHVVWHDKRDGNYEIYYKRSSDGGGTWGQDVRLTNDPFVSDYPSVAVSGSAVHVVWQDDRDRSRYPEIYYKQSTDGGTSWGADIRLTRDTALSYLPSMAVSGPVIHVVWHDERMGLFDLEVFYKRSSDGGTTWGPDTVLSDVPVGSAYSSVAVSGSMVHVVWDDYRDGNDEIYYKRSTDSGLTWEPDVRLTEDPASSGYPSVAVSETTVHVVWNEDRDRVGYPEIYYKRSTNGGITWGSDVRLTYDPATSQYPSIVSSGAYVHATWRDTRDGMFLGEVYYKCSTDAGVTWASDTRLTNSPDTSYNPFLAVSGQRVHVVWRDSRDGNREIYYKRNPTGNSGTEGSERPFSVGHSPFTVLPNPFASFATIPGHELESFELYDIAGRMVGTYKGKRIGVDLAPGIYFVKKAFKSSALLRVVKIK